MLFPTYFPTNLSDFCCSLEAIPEDQAEHLKQTFSILAAKLKEEVKFKTDTTNCKKTNLSCLSTAPHFHFF